jgi:hypothetical protein
MCLAYSINGRLLYKRLAPVVALSPLSFWLSVAVTFSVWPASQFRAAGYKLNHVALRTIIAALASILSLLPR